MPTFRSDLAYTFHDSPIGPLLLAGDGDALHLISLPGGSRSQGPRPGWRRDDALFADVRKQFDAYFAGELDRFDLSLQPQGTPFQLAVWSALRDIPYGRTASYGDIAKAIGRPAAVRAVGAANAANPLPIVVPCHRVIGASGALTGFGGGMDAKRFLLGLEGEPASLFGRPHAA